VAAVKVGGAGEESGGSTGEEVAGTSEDVGGSVGKEIGGGDDNSDKEVEGGGDVSLDAVLPLCAGCPRVLFLLCWSRAALCSPPAPDDRFPWAHHEEEMAGAGSPPACSALLHGRGKRVQAKEWHEQAGRGWRRASS